MQVPRIQDRSAVLVAVLALLCLLLPGCGGTTGGSGAEGADGAGTTASSSTNAAPPASPEPADTPADQVEDVLTGLDRRAQVAQLFVIGVQLVEVDAGDLEAGDSLAEAGVGGIFLAGRSEATVTDIAAVTERWTAAAPGPPPWIAVDQEGGAVQSLKGAGFDRLPPAREQGALPADELGALAEELGASLSTAGIDLDLAPVVDVVPPGTEAGNPPMVPTAGSTEERPRRSSRRPAPSSTVWPRPA